MQVFQFHEEEVFTVFDDKTLNLKKKTEPENLPKGYNKVVEKHIVDPSKRRICECPD